MDSEALSNEQYSGNAFDAVKELFGEVIDVKAKDENGNTLIHRAAASNKFELLRYLIEELKADVNVKNNDNETPLNVAVDKLAVESTRVLVDNNCYVNNRMKNGETPLMSVLNWKTSGKESRAQEIFNILIKSKKIDIEATEKRDGRTALHIAAEFGNVDAVKEITNIEPSLGSKADDFGDCAIHLAAKDGHKSVVEALLENGKVNKNIAGRECKTALHCATNSYRFDDYDISKRFIQIIEFLVYLGADCNKGDYSGATVLHYAFHGFLKCCSSKQSRCKFERCIDVCKEIHKIYENHSKLLEKNCVFLSIAEFYIRNGDANIHLKNDESKTPLELGIGLSIVFYFEQLWNYVHFTKHFCQFDSMHAENRRLTVSENLLNEKVGDKNADTVRKLTEEMKEKDEEIRRIKMNQITQQKKIEELENIISSFELSLQRITSAIEVKDCDDKYKVKAINNCETARVVCQHCRERQIGFKLMCGHQFCDDCYQKYGGCNICGRSDY